MVTDTIFVDTVSTATVNSDYCVPGDGLSHFHPSGMHTALADTAKWGHWVTPTSFTTTGATYKHSCLQGFLERPEVEDATYFLHNEINAAATDLLVGGTARTCYVG